MKTEDLRAQGLTQEQIDYVFAEHGKELNPIKQERDNFKSQYEQAKTALDGFQGVDVSELQGNTIGRKWSIVQLKCGCEKLERLYRLNTLGSFCLCQFESGESDW